LRDFQNLKMARSPHAFIRGTTAQFYRWLDELKKGTLPEGPAIWILSTRKFWARRDFDGLVFSKENAGGC
jgi:uncharacterized protein (DUF2252 family)